jgi:branched-chain amino acid transport system substrate-binding protein
VKYDAEGTGLGWATSATILAKDVDQPNTCKMKRRRLLTTQQSPAS